MVEKNHCYFVHEISYLLTSQASIAWEAFRQVFLLDVVEQVTSPLVFVITISTSPKVSSHHSLAENHLVAAEFVLDNRAQDKKDLGHLDRCIVKERVGSLKFVVIPICRIERGSKLLDITTLLQKLFTYVRGHTGPLKDFSHPSPFMTSFRNFLFTKK